MEQIRSGITLGISLTCADVVRIGRAVELNERVGKGELVGGHRGLQAA